MFHTILEWITFPFSCGPIPKKWMISYKRQINPLVLPVFYFPCANRLCCKHLQHGMLMQKQIKSRTPSMALSLLPANTTTAYREEQPRLGSWTRPLRMLGKSHLCQKLMPRAHLLKFSSVLPPTPTTKTACKTLTTKGRPGYHQRAQYHRFNKTWRHQIQGQFTARTRTQTVDRGTQAWMILLLSPPHLSKTLSSFIMLDLKCGSVYVLRVLYIIYYILLFFLLLYVQFRCIWFFIAFVSGVVAAADEDENNTPAAVLQVEYIIAV